MVTKRQQTYLTGPTLSLRAVEASDAVCEPSWRQSWFPRALAVSEAKHLLPAYAFEVLNLHMVWSTVWEANPRSRAALLKQGYRSSGCIPWRGIHHGIPSGDWEFDLLASEWQAARR